MESYTSYNPDVAQNIKQEKVDETAVNYTDIFATTEFKTECVTGYDFSTSDSVTKTEDELGIDMPYVCTLCGIRFTRERFLADHHKTNCVDLPSINSSGVLLQTKINDPGRFAANKECDQTKEVDACGKPFTKNSVLNTHQGKDTGEGPYECEICGKPFLSTVQLVRHEKKHAVVRSFSCNVCGKAFTDNSNLKVHQRIHTGEKPFKCEICEKPFICNSNLLQHKKIHVGEKKFKCDFDRCGKAFLRRNDLTRHQKLHTGVKAFKCSICGRAFFNKGNLDVHQRLHTGVKPFKCETCGKDFPASSNLCKHRKIHISGKASNVNVSNASINSTIHQPIYTGEKPFKCEICGKPFMCNNNLIRHKQIHSG